MSRRRHVRRPLAVLLTGVLLACPGAAVADEAYFYKGHDYGSQASYNPLTVLLNRGFDVLQLRPEGRDIRKIAYRGDLANIAENLAHPFANVEGAGGWGKLLRQEIFPLSYTLETARWGPNYALHLIGGGQTYRALREWYEAHDVPAPIFFSILTTVAAQVTNETLENKGVKGPNTDAIADLYLFDIGGILLFSVDRVARFFGETVVVADWSLQPTFRVPEAEIHNQGNYYALRWAFPFYERIKAFMYTGFSNMGGLSLSVGGGYALTAAGGGKINSFRNEGVNSVENVIQNKPAGAIFIDRNDSLLASLEVADVPDYFVHLNVYPNALRGVNRGIGGFLVVAKDGRAIGGLSFTVPFGVGISGGNF